MLSLVVASCGGGGGSEVESSSLSPAARRGLAVAERRTCLSCHTTDGDNSIGPTWKDLAGSERTLDDGRTVTADAAYLRRAIVDPQSEAVQGYPNIMPPYGDRLSEAEVTALLAYLEELSSFGDEATAPS